MLNKNYKGEDTEIEMEAIRKFFGNRSIEKVTDYNRQVKGIDYIIDGKLKVDTKIHYYKADILLYEFDDMRPGYKGRAWGDPNANKETHALIWIMAAYNKAVLYDYRKLITRYDEFTKEWVYKPYMNSREGTKNIWVPIEETGYLKAVDLDCSKLQDQVKQNYYEPSHKIEYDELKKLFDVRVKQLRHGAGEDLDDADFYEFYVKPFKESKFYTKLLSDKDLFGESLTYTVALQHKGIAL